MHCIVLSGEHEIPFCVTSDLTQTRLTRHIWFVKTLSLWWCNSPLSLDNGWDVWFDEAFDIKQPPVQFRTVLLSDLCPQMVIEQRHLHSLTASVARRARCLWIHRNWVRPYIWRLVFRMNAWHCRAHATSWQWDKCLCRAGSSNMPSYMPVISLGPGCMPGYMSLAAMRPHSLSTARFQMQCLLLFFHCITQHYIALCGQWMMGNCPDAINSSWAHRKKQWTWVYMLCPGCHPKNDQS